MEICFGVTLQIYYLIIFHSCHLLYYCLLHGAIVTYYNFLHNDYFYITVGQSHLNYRLQVMLILLLWLKTVLWSLKVWLETSNIIERSEKWESQRTKPKWGLKLIWDKWPEQVMMSAGNLTCFICSSILWIHPSFFHLRLQWAISTLFNCIWDRLWIFIFSLVEHYA